MGMVVIRGIMPRIYCTCERRLRKCWNAGASPTMPIGLKPDLMDQSHTLIGPGEGNLVERFGPELLRGARHHAAAERAIELGRRIIVGKRPDYHALQAALRQIAPRGVEQPAAEAEPLEFRTQIKLVDLAFEVQAAGAIAAVIGVACDLVGEYQHADAAALADRAVPPLRAAAVDQLFQLGAGDDALIG